MTARLLSRWALLLSRCPQPSASTAHLKALAALPVEPLWSQAWIQTPVRPFYMSRENAQEEKTKTTSQQTNFHLRIDKAATPKEVLNLWKNLGGSTNQAATCLVQIYKLSLGTGVKSDSSILNDPRFAEMLKAVHSQVSVIHSNTLVSLLRALCVLGVSPHSKVLQSLQHETLWRLRRLNVRQLTLLVDWTSGHPDYKEGNELLTSAALKSLELRWTELTEPRTIRVLMTRAVRHSPGLMDKLEDKALELAWRFTAEDIRVMLLILASHQRRAVALLRALSYHLDQKPSSELNTPLLMDIAYAYGRLNFQHTPMLQRIVTEMIARLQELTANEVSRCTKSLGFVKWLHLPLFEGCAQHFLNQSQHYTTQQLCNLILSFARLNFQPSNMEEFYKKVHESLEGSWQELDPFLKADLVWSLCVLQQAKPEHIAAVADCDFQTKLTGVTADRREGYRLKLTQIAASGQLESIGASSVLPTIHIPALQGKAPATTPLQSSLSTALQNLTRSFPNSLRTDVNTVYGWTVDAELVVDSENKPINLEKLVAPHLPGGGGSEQLPQGAYRLAFLVWDYNHFLSTGKELLGRFVMQKRHLELAGFLVVEVPYYEWQELNSDWKKEAYLKDKIAKAVAEDRAK
ncbi:FAST kinase domain-containing protein 4 [Astyanax mexicanus]|uniref:FAST kinase domain-containing protein 4 n=1 Tax=Astyanax mexicanus TaxID=7994 RepID=UPI0020CAAE72|nr:FAST kinase domain-containing protein 4 [Astyanax mexicanus]